MTTATLVRNFKRRIGATGTLVSDVEAMDILNLARMEIDDYVIEGNSTLYNMIFYSDLDAGVREYRISSDIRHIYKVFIKHDDEHWIALKKRPFVADWRSDDEDTIEAHYTNEEPLAGYSRNGNFIFINSGEIIDVTNGLKIYANGRPKDISDITENTKHLEDYLGSPDYTPGVPKEFIPHWITLASRLYKMEADKSATLDDDEQIVYDKLQLASLRIKDKTPVVQGSPNGKVGRYDGY